MNDHTLRDQYWRKTRTLTFILLALAAGLTIAILIFANALNHTALFGFPLGYLLAVNGVIVLCITIVFWGAIRQETIDRDSNLGEDQ